MTRSPRFVPALVLVLWAAAASAASAAASREVDVKRFPRLVRVFLLPDEAAVLKELKDDKDRVEFQRIFWARRDPTPGTPVNEFEENVRAQWKAVGRLLQRPRRRRASETGCGQVLALLGRPEEIVGKGVVPQGARSRRRATAARRSNAAAVRAPAPAARSTAWPTCATARRASRRRGSTATARACPTSSPKAELRVDFDAECRYAEGAGILGDDLRRVGRGVRDPARHRLREGPRRAPPSARGGGGLDRRERRRARAARRASHRLRAGAPSRSS